MLQEINLVWCEVAFLVFFAHAEVKVLSPGPVYSEREIRDLEKGVQERDSYEKDFSHLVLMLSCLLISCR